MRRLFHRGSLTGVVAAAAGFMTFGHEGWAQGERLSIAAQASRPTVIREHAGWDKACEAVAPPALLLSDPPSHGTVCARAENIKISSMYTGTQSQCVGSVVRGLRLVYRADPAYAGEDTLRYAVQYPNVLRSIEVGIAVAASKADAVPSGITGPAPQVRQSPGPVPFCADPVF